MKEHRLRGFETKVLGKIFGSRKDEVPGKWRRLHNEDLHDQYSSPNVSQIKKNEMPRTCGRFGEDDMSIQGFKGEI